MRSTVLTILAGMTLASLAGAPASASTQSVIKQPPSCASSISESREAKGVWCHAGPGTEFASVIECTSVAGYVVGDWKRYGSPTPSMAICPSGGKVTGNLDLVATR